MKAHPSCSRCGKPMKCVATHVNGQSVAIGYVCECGHYGIVHVHRVVKFKVDSISEHPALTLDGALPVHREIIDRLHELGKF